MLVETQDVIAGLLSPFGKIDGLYFDGSDEKNNFTYEFQKDLAEIEKQQGIEYIKMDFDSENDFYNALMEMQSYANDNIAFYGTSKSGHCEVVIESEKSDDDDEEETTTTKRKKKKSEEEVEEIDETIEVEDDSTDDSEMIDDTDTSDE